MDSLSSIKAAGQLHRSLRQKEAGGFDPDAARIDQYNELRSTTLSNFAKMLLLGGGVGLGARGIQGLVNLVARNSNELEEDEDDDLIYVNSPIKMADENPPVPQQPTNADRAWWTALRAPLAVGGAGLGLFGGWNLMDYLMDKRREDESDDELAEAKLEYEEALQGATKSAADNELSRELDKLADATEKAAGFLPSWDEILGMLGPEAAGNLGGYYAGLYALPSMAVAAGLSYPIFRKHQNKRLLEKAIRKRRQAEGLKTPKPIRLTLQPMLTRDEEEEKDDDIAAAINMSPSLDFEDSLDRV
jgi:hypothetical protein